MKATKSTQCTKANGVYRVVSEGSTYFGELREDTTKVVFWSEEGTEICTGVIYQQLTSAVNAYEEELKTQEGKRRYQRLREKFDTGLTMTGGPRSREC